MDKEVNVITGFFIVDNDGFEVLMGQRSPDGCWTPFIFANPANVVITLPEAIEISRMTKVPFKILQFSNREDLTEKYAAEFNDAIKKAKMN